MDRMGITMKKIIEIDLCHVEDLVEKYNQNRVSRDLIDYIISESILIGKKDSLKLVIYNKCQVENCWEMIQKGLEQEYKRSLKYDRFNDMKQWSLLGIGLFFLLLTILFEDPFLINEVFLIIGWVSIWEVVDISLFKDIKERRKRQILKKLLMSEYEVITK